MEFTKINGLVYHYQLLKNDGKPNLVFINSLGTDFRIWDDVVESLKSEYQILRFDKSGHGLSEQPKSIHYTIEKYAEDLKKLLMHIGWKKASVVGISIGGLIAQSFSLQFPESVEKLVLSNTSAKIGDNTLWEERITSLQENDLASIAPNIIQRWFSSSFLESNPITSRFYEQMILSCRLGGYLAACNALKEADFRDKVSSIQAKTLSIMGEEDLATPPASQAVFKQIPNLQEVVIEKAGHLPCIEKPELYASILQKFLKK